MCVCMCRSVGQLITMYVLNMIREWLFEQFDEQKCVNLGRIYRALGLPAMKLADEEEVLKKVVLKGELLKGIRLCKSRF